MFHVSCQWANDYRAGCQSAYILFANWFNISKEMRYSQGFFDIIKSEKYWFFSLFQTIVFRFCFCLLKYILLFQWNWQLKLGIRFYFFGNVEITITLINFIKNCLKCCTVRARASSLTLVKMGNSFMQMINTYILTI